MKLERCPFCGGNAEVKRGTYDTPNGLAVNFSVECVGSPDCPILWMKHCPTEIKASEAWNHREPTGNSAND